MVTIRPARPEDAAAIQLLNRECMGYDADLDKTRERLEALYLREDHCILVAALDQDTIAGYVHLADYDTLYFGPMKNVLAIAVFPEFRRRGIATRLLGEAEEWALESGAAGVRLVSGIQREEAHAFYRRMDYQETHAQKNFRKMFRTEEDDSE